jgi:hypothetical protein
VENHLPLFRRRMKQWGVLVIKQKCFPSRYESHMKK